MKCIVGRFFMGTLVAVSLVSLGSPLFAQDKKDRNAGLASPEDAGCSASIKFADLRARIDLDKDGFITREEWNRVFQKMDENGDNRLSVAEIQQLMPEEGETAAANSEEARVAAFVRLDANRNGVIELSEWPGSPRSFRYLDVNKDKVISREEFLSKKARWWNQTFANLDLDGNRIITRSEWMDSDADFNRLDRDHNGGIDRREFYNPR